MLRTRRRRRSRRIILKHADKCPLLSASVACPTVQNLNEQKEAPHHGCPRRKPQFLSCAESAIISLHASLRMDGSPALQFWECVLEALSCETVKKTLRIINATKSFRLLHILTMVYFESTDQVPPNIPTAPTQPNNIFEDIAAVIEMINQGRSPNSRHGTRTHRVGLDWLFRRMHLDHSMLIKCRFSGGYVDKLNVHYDANGIHF